MVKMIEKGDTVPDFVVENQHGEKISSEDIEDAVIYFYPKADTAGCTKEACNFRDSIESFRNLDLDIYGVSTDSVEAQKSFAEKNNLEFDLLADSEGEISESFDILKDSGYAERTTFIIQDREVEKVFHKVRPEEHVEEVLNYLDQA